MHVTPKTDAAASAAHVTPNITKVLEGDYIIYDSYAENEAEDKVEAQQCPKLAVGTNHPNEAETRENEEKREWNKSLKLYWEA